MYDFHIHSIYSNDCKYDLEDMVKSAVARKLKMIYCCDHFDVHSEPYKDLIFNPDEYRKEIRRINKKYKDIEILSGIELNLDLSSIVRVDNVVDLNEFDMIILAFHRINNVFLNDINYEKIDIDKNIYREYYKQIYNVIKKYKNYDVLGHIDYIDRFGPDLKFAYYKDIVAEILKILVKENKGLEVSTSGYSHRVARQYPKKEILTLYKKLGGENIIVGSDAHYPEHVGFNCKSTINYLKKLGFKNISVFRKRSLQKIKI
jgi:histidinol-phosphatase (PHP family)